MPPKRKKNKENNTPSTQQQKSGEGGDDAFSCVVRVLLQEKVKEVEEKMQQLVSLLEREKSESEKLSGELRCDNKYLKEELHSLKISTKCCLEQNQPCRPPCNVLAVG